MSLPAIKSENLSKQYRIGEYTGYKTIRETLVNLTKASFRGVSDTRTIRQQRSQDQQTIWALKDVSFEVEPGDVVGIIGRNGAGKSTLLKILSKISDPTKGRVELRGRVGSLLEIGTGFHPELTGHENIYLYGAILGMSRWEVTRKFDEIVAFAELEKFIETPVKRYSSGMYMRLAFAVAAHLETEILLVDEVLAVGDSTFQKRCMGKMNDVSKEGRTVLFVSHNMAAIQYLCQSALLISKGRLVQTGVVTEVIKSYEAHTLSDNSGSDTEPNLIYRSTQPVDQLRSKFEIIQIQIFDGDNLPKDIVATWDRIKLRITCRANEAVKLGSAVVQIATTYGVVVFLSSTQPDSTVPFHIKAGCNAVECEISSLPLSAGQYVIGAGLAIPNKEWLCWRENFGIMTVHPSDVYQSGLAPVSPRSLMATHHVWRIL